MRIFAVFAAVLLSHAAGQDRNMAANAAASPKASAPVDMTGYWVALVTEDWRFRMIHPRKGDYQAVPMTEQARKIANAWDPALDEASGDRCKAYGAAAIMRLPARFHITWQDDNTMQVESDSGMQKRLFHFHSPPSSPGEHTRQGYSTAQWQSAALKIVTANLRSGYLRKNGIPYSENAVVTEYFDIAPHPSGGHVLVVTTIVDGPLYLQQPFIVSSRFKNEAHALQ